MSEELGQIIALNRRILGDLDSREQAVAEKEAEARRALERALQACAAEKARIVESRELLTQTENLYRDYLGAQLSRVQPAAPVTLSVVSSRQEPAQSASPEPMAPPQTEPAAVEAISPGIDDLRAKVAKEYQEEEANQQANGGRRWSGMWR